MNLEYEELTKKILEDIHFAIVRSFLKSIDKKALVTF